MIRVRAAAALLAVGLLAGTASAQEAKKPTSW